MIEEAYFSVSRKINPGYLESMAILFPLRGEIIKRVQKELIQGPKFNKPQAPQGPISQLKSVKERPELQGKRKVTVAFDEEEEESPEPPLATKSVKVIVQIVRQKKGRSKRRKKYTDEILI